MRRSRAQALSASNMRRIMCAAGKPRPAEKGGSTEMFVIPAPLTMVTALGAMRVTMPEDLRPAENRRAVLNMLRVRPRPCACLSALEWHASGPDPSCADGSAHFMCCHHASRS